MTKKTGFTIKELVLLGTMNAVLLFLWYMFILVLHMLPPLWGFMDPICNFLLAPVYILMLRLVPKMFVMTIHGTIIGLFSILTGWWPGLLAGVAAGLAADLAARLAGGYSRPWSVFFSIPVFVAVKTLLYYLPLYGYALFPVFKEVITLWPEEAVTGYTVGFAAFVLLVNLGACLIGLKLGQGMLARHFGRAGLVKV